MTPDSTVGPAGHRPTTARAWMTCVADHREHALLDQPPADWRSTDTYPAVCGHIVTPDALIAPPGRRCSRCLAVL